MVKTESQMLEKAIEIANSDSNARVCFFFKDYNSSFSVRKAITEDMSLYDGAVWRTQALEYVAENGGRLKVLYCKPEEAHNMSGMQFTHVFYETHRFVREDRDLLNFLKSKIRSAKYDGEMPMGMYNEYLAEINVSY